MKKVTNQILAFFLLVVLAGCSPSDEGGGGGSTAKSYGLTEGGTVRNMTAGDYWKYTGSLTVRQGSTAVDADYEVEETNSNAGVTQYSSLPVTVHTTSSKLVSRTDGSVEQSTKQNHYVTSGGIDYLIMEQGADNLFYAVNQLNGEPYAVAKLVTDGSYSTGYTIGTCSSYTNFNCVNHTTVANYTINYTIIGTETVSTTVGNFESHKINFSGTQTSITSAFSNASLSGTYWYYPALGIVKVNYTSSFTDYSPALINEATITLNQTNNSKYSRSKRGLNLMSTLPIFQMLQPIQ